MQLKHGLHLAYCTNIHRGENWEQTFETLKKFTLPVRDRVSPNKPYAIGLRLGDQASRELSDPGRLTDFQRWLEKENCEPNEPIGWGRVTIAVRSSYHDRPCEVDDSTAMLPPDTLLR